MFQKTIKDFERIENLFAQAVNNAIESGRGSSETDKFSIKKSLTGEVYVEVGEDILEENGETYARLLSEIVSNDFKGLVNVNKQDIVLTKKDTVNEWIFSKSAKNLRLNNQNSFKDKIRAFKNIDELLTAANNWIGEKAKHYHFKEFARGKVDFKVGVNGYTADIIVGINSNNIAILYDLVNITDKKITEANKTIHSQSRASRNIASVINSISEEHGNVNKFSQRNISNRDSEGNELTKEQQEYFKDSKVRDKDGNLKVMYHGSPNEFTVFDKKKARASGLNGRGFYFTDSQAHAGTYGNMKKYYLNIEKSNCG